MGLIGVANTNERINQEIRKIFSDKASMEYSPRFPIINFSDKTINIEQILKEIRQDSWLHAFGIIGLYDRSFQNEKEVLRSLKDINVLAMVDINRVKTNLMQIVKIIDENRQIIFHWELADKLVEQATGSFVIENNPLVAGVFAGLAATTLVQRGSLDPGHRIDLQLALTELILNGIEHGNCGITFDEKTAYMTQGKNMADLVADKCKDPVIAAKKVYLEWEIKTDESVFSIRDEGNGEKQ